MIRTLKDAMVERVLSGNIKEYIRKNNISPSYFELLQESQNGINTTLSLSSIPSVQYMQNTSSSDFEAFVDNINGWLKLISKTLDPIINDYKNLTSSYKDISVRIFNEIDVFKNRISRLSNPSCYYISPLFSDQTEESNCGKIGKFITLPFLMTSAQMFSGSVLISAVSSGNIIFGNIKDIGSLPLNDWITMKVSGGRTENVNLAVSLQRLITANAFYLKMLNPVTKVSVSFLLNGTLVYTAEADSNEIFINFEPIEFSNINISITYNNSNTDKPFAVDIQSIEIFEKIQFSRNGFFESRQVNIEETENANFVGVSYNNTGSSQYTNVKNLISVSMQSDIHDYGIVDDMGKIDISVHKYRYGHTYTQFDVDSNGTDVNIRFPDDGSDRIFYRLPIDQNVTPDLYNMDYENALIFHGLPKQYARTTNAYAPSPDLIYENWTKSGNYWKTMCIVYEDNVTVDVGNAGVIINGASYKGKVIMPKGISSIEVHEKDIDFKFGKSSNSNIDVTNPTTIYSDPLYPFNFAYVFSGLPDFTTDGQLAEKTERNYSIVGGQISTILLGESFIPLTLDIIDSLNNQYELVLTKGVSKKGTYSIDPYTGRIKVFAMDNTTTITVSYRRASQTRRPVGVLFNRLLTFMPIKTLLGLAWREDMFFSLDGGPSEKNILIQEIPGKRIVNSQILFNRADEDIWASVKLQMETKNRYLTPIISDIYITTE